MHEHAGRATPLTVYAAEGGGARASSFDFVQLSRLRDAIIKPVKNQARLKTNGVAKSGQSVGN